MFHNFECSQCIMWLVIIWLFLIKNCNKWRINFKGVCLRQEIMSLELILFYYIFSSVSSCKFCLINNGITHLLKHFGKVLKNINLWTYFIYLKISANLCSMLNQAMLKHVKFLNEERRILLLLIVCIKFFFSCFRHNDDL